ETLFWLIILHRLYFVDTIRYGVNNLISWGASHGIIFYHAKTGFYRTRAESLQTQCHDSGCPGGNGPCLLDRYLSGGIDHWQHDCGGAIYFWLRDVSAHYRPRPLYYRSRARSPRQAQPQWRDDYDSMGRFDPGQGRIFPQRQAYQHYRVPQS